MRDRWTASSKREMSDELKPGDRQGTISGAGDAQYDLLVNVMVGYGV